MKNLKLYVLCTLFGMNFVQMYAQRAVEFHFQDVQTRALDINSNAYVKPMTVELKMLDDAAKVFSTKLTKDKAEKELKGDLENIRSYATYLYADKERADIIVAPTYNIETNDEGGYTVTVKGFPAVFTKWQTASEADYEWIKMVQTERTSDKEKTKALSK